jgi:hypothetical protein
MTGKRYVSVRIGTPGLGLRSETYDRLDVSDCVVWRLNTSPPSMQLGISPHGDDIVGPAQESALVFVTCMARDEAKQLKKAKD